MLVQRLGSGDLQVNRHATWGTLIAVMIYPTALLSFLLLPVAVSAQSSLAEGTGRLQLQSAGGSHPYAKVQFPDGRVAERFIVRPGDCVRRINDCSSNRERVEFSGARSPIRQGQEVWLSWSVFVPGDFPIPRPGGTIYTLGQVHQHGDSGPELMFQVFEDGLYLIMKDPYNLDDDPMNPIPDFRQVRLASAGQLTGRWHDVRVQANFTRGNDGYINVWFNDRDVFSYAGPTSNDRESQFFKYGLYRSSIDGCGGPCPEAAVYYSDVRQGRSRADVE